MPTSTFIPRLARPGLALATLLCCAAGPAAASIPFTPVMGWAALPAAAQAPAFPALPAGLVAPGLDLGLGLAGINSFDAAGAAINTVISLPAQPGALVDQISWTLQLSTVGASWLDEATVLVTNSSGQGVFFNPGFGDGFSGTASYAASGSLAAQGFAFNVLADGQLFVSFYELWDDNPGAADARYLSGSLTLAGVALIPEPATPGLLALGLLALAGLKGRRSAAAKASSPDR